MDLHINHLLHYSVHLFREKLIPSLTNQQQRTLAITLAALTALGGLAACFYLFMRRSQSETVKIDKKVIPHNQKDDLKPIHQEQFLPELEDQEEILNEDLQTEEGNHQQEKKNEDQEVSAKPKEVKSQDDLLEHPLPVPFQFDEDAELAKALQLSLQEAQPNSMPNPPPFVPNPPPFVKNLPPRVLPTSLSIPKLVPKQPQVGNDPDLQAALKESEKEARQKLDLELRQALERTRGNGSFLNPAANPQAPVLKPSYKLPTPQKTKPVLEEDLLKTTQAKSENCDKPLQLAVEKARQSKNLRILKHEIKRNEGGNAFLVLHFANKVHCNLAVEELRTKYSMFQPPATPLRIEGTILELTVEQTIEFNNKF